MVSQAGRCIALIERITHRHKREPQADYACLGLLGNHSTCCLKLGFWPGGNPVGGWGCRPGRPFVLNMT